MIPGAEDVARDCGLRVATEAREAGTATSIGWLQEADAIRTLATFPDFAAALRDAPEMSRFHSRDLLEQMAVAWTRRSSVARDPRDQWPTFCAEAVDPEWHYTSVANLRNFHADRPEVAFHDGLASVERSLQRLSDLTHWGP